MEHDRQGLMSLTLALHWVWSKSVVTLAGNGHGKQSVGEHGVWELLVPQHLVIGQEAMGEGRV